MAAYTAGGGRASRTLMLKKGKIWLKKVKMAEKIGKIRPKTYENG